MENEKKRAVYSNKRMAVNMVLAPFSYYVIMQLVSILVSVYDAARLAADGVSGDALSEQLTALVNSQSVLISMISALLALPLVYFLFYRRQEKEPMRGCAASLLIMLPFGAAACLTDNLLISISHISTYFPEYEEIAEYIYQGNILLEIVGVAILPGIIEELIYRGVLYRGLRRFLRPVWAALLSAFIFGAMHGNVVQFVYAFVLALLFAWVYEAYKSLLAPMLMHAAANLFSVLLTEWQPLTDFTATAAGMWTILIGALVLDIAVPVYLCKVKFKK